MHGSYRSYHLALLDINLPDGNGLDLCSEIKGHSPETYIIFLTANDRESDMLRGYEAGIVSVCKEQPANPNKNAAFGTAMGCWR